MTTPLPEPDHDTSRRMPAWVPPVAIVTAVVVLALGGLVLYMRSRTDEVTRWPRSSQFRPAGGLGGAGTPAEDVEADIEPGVYVFQDFQGWHLWVVNGEEIGPVRGVLSSDEDFVRADAAIDGAGTVELSGAEVTFDLPDDPSLVGVDFATGFFAQEVTFDLEGPDGPLDAEIVTVGRSASVDEMPFDIRKVPESRVDES